MSNAAGSVAAYYGFKPFGERIGSGVGGRSSLWGADSGVKQQFTAKERDDESNLDYFGTRSPSEYQPADRSVFLT